VKAEGSGDELIVAAMRGPKGEVSAYVLNRSSAACEVSLEGLPHDAPLKQVTWNGDGQGKLGDVAEVKSADGVATVIVSAGGLVAVTTIDLKMP
jgi:hypothetical protein